MTIHYAYEDILKAAKRIDWTVEEIIGRGQQLDFTRPFMPESLARTEGLGFMNEQEKLIFNQIRGHSYLYIFMLVEEIILPFVEEHANREGIQNPIETEAFMQFAAEESKHIELFAKFREKFQADFGTEIEVIGPVEQIAKAIMANHPLAVAITTLHIEWMTQGHYVDSVKNNVELCPQYESLLRHHWMEEAQHAKLDSNMVLALGEGLSQDELKLVLEDYFKIGGILDDGLQIQAKFDREAFERVTGRILTPEECAIYQDVQSQAFRWTYLGSGMTHPNFLKTLEALAPFMRETVESISHNFC